MSAYERALALPTLLSTRKRALYRKAIAHAKLRQFAEERESLRAMHECQLKYSDPVTNYQSNIALHLNKYVIYQEKTDADTMLFFYSQDYTYLLPYTEQLVQRYPRDMSLTITRANVLLMEVRSSWSRLRLDWLIRKW